jgi:hypothetical protein
MLAIMAGLAALTGAFWLFAGAALWILQDLADRWKAGRHGYRARFWMPAANSWVRRRWRQLGGPPIPPGPIWEVHAQDQRRWPGSPHQAAQAYRQAYATDMMRLIAMRPQHVSLCCTTFNRLTPEEQAAIHQAGGWIRSGPLHPHLPTLFSPRNMRHIQRRMFGGLVSTTPRTNPAHWTTWVVPATVHANRSQHVDSTLNNAYTGSED